MKHSFAVFFVMICMVSSAWAHCQIPCGIYGDETRFDLLEEHIQTIEKSMKTIVHLGKSPDGQLNQIIRWVDNKDEHSDKIIEIVTHYFLAQRIKPIKSKRRARAKSRLYKAELITLHEMIVHAMKSKQTTDLNHVKSLKRLLTRFRFLYFGKIKK